MSPRPYDLTTHDGERVDWLTHVALLKVEEHLGYPLTITQGSYNAGGVSASAGTHDGGGVVDLAPYDHDRKVDALRRVGFAAWHRPELWRGSTRVWPAHVHAVLIGNARLAPAARDQVADYLAGRNGLADNGPDTGPREWVDRRFSWRTGAHRITRARLRLEQARALLTTGTRGYKLRKARRAINEALRELPEVADT